MIIAMISQSLKENVVLLHRCIIFCRYLQLYLMPSVLKKTNVVTFCDTSDGSGDGVNNVMFL
jgi:hypothetical protein